MPNYEYPDPTPGCAFPKLRRVRHAKRKASGWKKAKIGTDENGAPCIIPDHDNVLDACLELCDHAGCDVLHIPNELYQLIALPSEGNPLAYVFEKALGQSKAMHLKKVLATSFKGIVDIIVWLPLEDGMNLSMMGDIKTGKAKLNHGQRIFGKTASIKVWRSVDEFKKDFEKFQQMHKRILGLQCTR